LVKHFASSRRTIDGELCLEQRLVQELKRRCPQASGSSQTPYPSIRGVGPKLLRLALKNKNFETQITFPRAM